MTQPTPVCWGVIPAAGKGLRMQSAVPKQYLPLGGSSVLAQSVTCLLALPALRGVVVVVEAGEARWQPQLAPLATNSRPVWTTLGGADRASSVLAGLQALATRASLDHWVLVHDAARPCVGPAALAKLVEALVDEPVGALLAVPVRDTLKRASADGRAAATVPREGLWQAQTPQAFRLGLLLEALQRAREAKAAITDEASAVEAMGLYPRLVVGEWANLKITEPGDLAIAEGLWNLTRGPW